MMKTNSSSRRSEAGSAYIITLLALVVLTIMALSLALVTQTEVQVGANEKTVNRTFYAADSGLGVAAAEALTSGRYTGMTVLLNKRTDPITKLNTADRVTISPFVPIATVRCDWCPANDDGVPKFWKTNHAVSATAQRIGWNGVGDPPLNATLLGQKTLSVMFEFQPWATPPVESLPDADSLAQITF